MEVKTKGGGQSLHATCMDVTAETSRERFRHVNKCLCYATADIRCQADEMLWPDKGLLTKGPDLN